MGDIETSEEETTELARNARRCRNVPPLRSRRKRKKKEEEEEEEEEEVWYGIIVSWWCDGDDARGSGKLAEGRNVEKTMQFANANHESYVISDVSQLSEVFHRRRFESYDLTEISPVKTEPPIYIRVGINYSLSPSSQREIAWPP
ncbi:hypothetical protein V1478_010590, partial [Vespula squamosa]